MRPIIYEDLTHVTLTLEKEIIRKLRSEGVNISYECREYLRSLSGGEYFERIKELNQTFKEVPKDKMKTIRRLCSEDITRIPIWVKYVNKKYGLSITEQDIEKLIKA